MRATDTVDDLGQSKRRGGEIAVLVPTRLFPQASAADLEALCARALSRYGVRVLDNVDLSRLDGIAARGLVIARALMERGDARAFAMAREILAFIET